MSNYYWYKKQHNNITKVNYYHLYTIGLIWCASLMIFIINKMITCHMVKQYDTLNNQNKLYFKVNFNLVILFKLDIKFNNFKVSCINNLRLFGQKNQIGTNLKG